MFRSVSRSFKERSPYIDKDGHNIRLVPVDQFNSQTFNLGFNGLPANDITLLARAQSDLEYQTILARLKEQPQSKTNEGKTDKQIIAEMMPSWVQTPAEIDKFMDWYNKSHEVPFSQVTKTDSVSVDEKPAAPAASGDGPSA